MSKWSAKDDPFDDTAIAQNVPEYVLRCRRACLSSKAIFMILTYCQTDRCPMAEVVQHKLSLSRELFYYYTLQGEAVGQWGFEASINLIV